MSLLACVFAFTAIPAAAQNFCRFYLAKQADAVQGLTLSLETQSSASSACPLSAVNISFSVSDGTGFHHLSMAQPWQTGVVYTAKAVIVAAGPQQLSLNGQSLGTFQGTFKPLQGTFFGSLSADSGNATEGYVVTQISLQVSNGSNTVSIAPNGNNPVALPLILMSGPAPWPAALTVDPTQTTTIRATFRFDPVVSNPHQFDPYIDAYGQVTFSSWPGKVTSDSDLQAAIVEEQTWLANNGPLGSMDAYGGSTLAGWTDTAAGYYRSAFHNNRWWLISPLGNPLFYIGLDGIFGLSYTPITGRELMFANLPAQTGSSAAAYSQNVWGDTQNTTYVSFAVANRIRKYGSAWRDAQNIAASQRIAGWAFAGSGKWTHGQAGLSVNRVLDRSAVPNVVPGGHPDAWDPTILKQLTATLTTQIGSDTTNPNIIGWSVGNEKDEIVGSQEVLGILALGPSVPAKKALVDQALSAIYSGSVSALAAAWKITAANVADVYAAKPTAPAIDLETLRQYYERTYYSALYKTVQAIDPHHLYLGNWILPREYPTDWPILAANCDVIGMDFYSPTFLDPAVQALIQSAKKPVLIGEFSFPSAYGGMRGFGSYKYTGEITLSDSQSGDLYAQWLHDAGANPYVVGVEWFEYLDETVTGRGNNDGTSNISPSLVIAENFAFAIASALVAVGEFQINFTVPQSFASMPPGLYPISVSINGVTSPASINSSPPGPVVMPIQH